MTGQSGIELPRRTGRPAAILLAAMVLTLVWPSARAAGQQLRSRPGLEPFQEFYCYDGARPRVFQRYLGASGWGPWREHQLIDPDEVQRVGSVRVRWLGQPDQQERDRLGVTDWERLANAITDRSAANGRWHGRAIVFYDEEPSWRRRPGGHARRLEKSLSDCYPRRLAKVKRAIE